MHSTPDTDLLLGSAKEQTRNRAFDIFVAVDGGIDGARNFVVEVWLLRHFPANTRRESAKFMPRTVRVRT